MYNGDDSDKNTTCICVIFSTYKSSLCVCKYLYQFYVVDIVIPISEVKKFKSYIQCVLGLKLEYGYYNI